MVSKTIKRKTGQRTKNGSSDKSRQRHRVAGKKEAKKMGNTITKKISLSKRQSSQPRRTKKKKK